LLSLHAGSAVIEAQEQFCREALRNLRRALHLLALADEPTYPPADLAWLHSARTKLQLACDLLHESFQVPATRSVSELILKAEICLAAMDVKLNPLSLRIADALLLETRVRMESRMALVDM
jgi:hypothetical protein